MLQLRFLKYLLLLLFIFSSAKGQNDIYKYRISADTTLHGMILGEGNIFSSTEISLFLANNSTIFNDGKTKISIIDSNYSLEYEYIFGDKNYQIIKNIKIFDFNNDSLDEVLFGVGNNRVISIYRYSSKEQKPEKLFELNNSFTSNMFIRFTPIQFDDDSEFEFALTFGTSYEREGEIRGIIIYDFQTKKILLKTFSAEKYLGSTPISIVKNNNPIVIISTSTSLMKSSNIFYSDSTYFLKDHGSPNVIPYKTFYTNINSDKVDTLASDYSSDKYAHIRAITPSRGLLWEKNLGQGFWTTMHLMGSSANPKIILFSSNSKYQRGKGNTCIRIINPFNGECADSILLPVSLKGSVINRNRIISSFRDKSIIMLDENLNVLKKKKFEDNITLFGYKKIENDEIIIAKWGANSELQYLTLLDSNLNIRYQQRCSGSIHLLEKSKRIISNHLRKNQTTIYSIKPVPWFEQFSSKDLRNILIAGLFILLLFMVLWINTLRVSSKKISSQKNQLEKTHQELKNATDKLIRAEKLAVYGTIASGIAHEINSPLGAIINSAQRIKSNPGLNFEQNINLIEKAGKRSKTIIEKLLVNTREHTGNEATDVNSVLNDWKEISLRQFENLGIELIIDIACDDKINISSTELNQIFTNLLFNSRDAIMEAKSSVKKVFISVQKINEECLIIIKDTGPGFSEAKIKNPFAAFETTKEIGKGTGLGLWVVKNILDKIDGKIEIKNYEDGAEITISIPIEKKEA